MRAAACALLAAAVAAAPCSSALDCSLNGVCSASACVCDAPWAGAACERLAFATTPAAAKSLAPRADARNTWNGPIVAEADAFHAYVPVYGKGSLSAPESLLHGVASRIEGPYDWATYPPLMQGGENPAALVFVDPATGKRVVSVWAGGRVLVADTAAGPFVQIDRFGYVGGNPAPTYHDGAFYMTNQFTLQVFTTPRLAPGGVWAVYANISHEALPANDYHVEDPFLWVDSRNNWHIINHAYSNLEFENCSSSAVSAHFFSVDGRDWRFSAQPYDHEVAYDDGTSHSYVTLERPNLFFDAAGALTHAHFAADLVTGDEGCAARKDHARNGHCPCDDCKWDDLAGTIVVALGTA